jgi:hypothetical protein
LEIFRSGTKVYSVPTMNVYLLQSLNELKYY